MFLGIAALLSLAALLLPASARQSKRTASALAPLEIVVEDLGHLRGIAVDECGTAFVTDVKAGTLWRVVPDGPPAIVADRLKRPLGVAFDREGQLVLVEAGRRRILKLETEGGATPLASGMRHPRWIAAGPGGHLYVSAKSVASLDDDGDEDEAEPEMVVRVTPDGRAGVFAGGFRGLQGVASAEDALQVAARGRRGDPHATGALFEIPIQPDGRAGVAHPLATNAFSAPSGLAIDRLGARFVSAKSLAEQPWLGRVIVKVGHDGSATLFAAGLDDPRGLAFGPDGSLYLADGNSGRVLRFVAPPAPALEEVPPGVTNQRQIALRFTAGAGARVTVLGGEFPAAATVDDAGSATVSAPLRRNVENHLLVFATGSGGLGLTSTSLVVSITQDEEPPTVELLEPRGGTLVRGTIAAEARAADLNGIAAVEFRLDELVVGQDAAEPFRIVVDTRVAADGLRLVSALARDRAGNVARASALVTVDNAPPDVKIVAPAPGAVASGPVEVVVEASDVTSGVAGVELAVNGVSRFVAETPPYRFRFDPREIGPGPYVLVASAVDRAGNRGESLPVSIALSGVTVQISEPADGARLPAGLLLVKGRVEASGPEVGVTVNGFPAAVRDAAFAALIPVAPDTTTLTAVATADSGLTASHSVAIAVSSTPAPAATLLASPQSGVAPLSVTFFLLGEPASTSVEVDFDGNGTVDFSGTSLDGQSFTYAVPGIYLPMVTATDAQRTRITARAIIQVFDANALEALLQARWDAFKNALRQGDVEGALKAVALGTRERYRPALQVLGSDLPAFATNLGGLQIISLRDGLAEVVTVRLEDGQRRVYFIYLVPDDDGVWRILGM